MNERMSHDACEQATNGAWIEAAVEHDARLVASWFDEETSGAAAERCMISFDVDHARFNYRIAGIALQDDHVLLCQEDGQDFWFMPGGRAELREASAATLAREMREELGADVRVERLIWVVENFFRWVDGTEFHELCLYYLITLPRGFHSLGTGASFRGIEDDIHLIFRWYRLGDLEKIRVEPAFLRRRLCAIPEDIEHIVQRDDPS